MNNRLEPFKNDQIYLSLLPGTSSFLEKTAEEYYFSFQDIKKLLDIAADLEAWGERTLPDLWETPPLELKGKDRKHWSLNRIEAHWNTLKRQGPVYDNSAYPGPKEPASSADHVGPALIFTEAPADENVEIMGKCPVASSKTRCCNLLTLDAVLSCGFDCSYCTIQSFYSNNEIRFFSNLEEKLSQLESRLDPQEIYHIGTGQSSDSLLWGNRSGMLESLFRFAARHPRVILELKTKSDNVDYLLSNPPPPNVLLTWSLNTQMIIEKEEKGTASLKKRLDAAEKAADKGILVGFHFHPMVRYENWREDYTAVFREIIKRFDPGQTALVSLGTLTYIKPVLRKIRRRGLKTKILQMPLEETAGKFSYPHDVKKELFSLAWKELSPWHGRVFIYLCMEEPNLWKEVLGYEYPDNDSFEKAMKTAYLEKIWVKTPKKLL